MMQKIEVFGEVPLARFGHTITQGNSFLILIFNSIKVKDHFVRRGYRGHGQIYYNRRYIRLRSDFLQMD